MPQPPTRLLAKIGLAYVSDQEPGISREKRGRGSVTGCRAANSSAIVMS